MSETVVKRRRRLRHKGRISQIWIYLGKQFRFFINQNDWKVLPMAAIIAGLVGMVIRNRFFVNMEGSLMGGFALACVAIWNGCFNSIQSVVRERPIIKREHRSGMHISSYVIAHMIYQLLLCAGQTGITMYILKLVGVPFPDDKAVFTPLVIVDIGLSMLLITYASDMMSLFISSVAHTTTSAMTIMPFVLIFQLVFSGGIIPLPAWSRPISNFTISNYGIKTLAAQSAYNEQPMVTAWNTLHGMRDTEVGGTYTVADLLSLLESPVLAKYVDPELLDALSSSPEMEDLKKESFTLKATVGQLMDLVGEEKVKELVQKKTAEAAYKPEYARTAKNIARNWAMLGLFILVFALLATVSLELIDRDKR